MLKHLVHAHPNKLHTFDDFYRTTSKPIRTLSNHSDGVSSTNTSSSSSPISSSSPSNTSYTFYNIFSDFKSNSTNETLPEEDETESEQPTKLESMQGTPPLFYLDEDHHHSSPPLSQSQSQVTSQISTSSSNHSPSSHWPSLLLNRFRHSNHPLVIAKQTSLNENQMSSTKLRKSELTDPSMSRNPSNRFLKRSDTVDNETTEHSERKSSDHFNEDFPELSSHSSNRAMSSVKKHRSLASMFHHFPHPHLSSSNNSKSHSHKSGSTGTLHTETPSDHPRPKLVKQKAISSPYDSIGSPVTKSLGTPILPKLASFFQRHHHSHPPHLNEQYKYRVGNLKARLHHRRTSPSSSTTTKFQCPASNDLIRQIENTKEKDLPANHLIDFDTFHHQRSTKPVIMKRVHTWHNSFNLTPIDQCLEY